MLLCPCGVSAAILCVVALLAHKTLLCSLAPSSWPLDLLRAIAQRAWSADLAQLSCPLYCHLYCPSALQAVCALQHEEGDRHQEPHPAPTLARDL